MTRLRNVETTLGVQTVLESVSFESSEQGLMKSGRFVQSGWSPGNFAVLLQNFWAPYVAYCGATIMAIE